MDNVEGRVGLELLFALRVLVRCRMSFIASVYHERRASGSDCEGRANIRQMVQFAGSSSFASRFLWSNCFVKNCTMTGRQVGADVPLQRNGTRLYLAHRQTSLEYCHEFSYQKYLGGCELATHLIGQAWSPCSKTWKSLYQSSIAPESPLWSKVRAVCQGNSIRVMILHADSWRRSSNVTQNSAIVIGCLCTLHLLQPWVIPK